MSPRPYVASAKELTKARKRHLLALQLAGDGGLVGSLEHPTALLAALVTLGWATRARETDKRAVGCRFHINQAGREMLANAKKGRA